MVVNPTAKTARITPAKRDASGTPTPPLSSANGATPAITSSGAAADTTKNTMSLVPRDPRRSIGSAGSAIRIPSQARSRPARQVPLERRRVPRRAARPPHAAVNLNQLDLDGIVAGRSHLRKGPGMTDSVPARHAGRPRRAVLDKDRIAEAAMAIVDETGDFTVPELARRLGVQTG